MISKLATQPITMQTTTSRGSGTGLAITIFKSSSRRSVLLVSWNGMAAGTVIKEMRDKPCK